MPLLKPGEFIDERYEVVEVLGTGAFGTVYKAMQSQFDRLVAVKLLNRTVDNAEEVSRFEQEAKAMNALKHKSIVSFYGLGFWHGAPYMVTELATGENLFQLLTRTPQVERVRSLTIIQQVLSALSCAHQQGIVHRDLKPSNIILSKDADGFELVKIIDFGLAKMLPGYGIPSQKLTETGFALGTVQYMSPEQCTGGVVDGRADLYSAGCIMYQCLTGRLPFEASEAIEVMYQHLNATPEPLTKYLPADPTTNALQNFCNNCLAKDADMRYTSAEEALRDISAIAMGQSSKVKAFVPTSSSKRRQVTAAQKKSRQPLMLAVATAAAILVGGIYFFAFMQKAPDTVTRSDKTRITREVSLNSKLNAEGLEEKLKVSDKGLEDLVKEITLDRKDGHLTPYHRARIAYVLAVHYQYKANPAEAEKYARLAWGERQLATTYPFRARNLLIGFLIAQGKFEEADALTRDMVKSEDPGTIPNLRDISIEYAFVNRMDRAKALLESLLGMPTLKPGVKQFCYSLMGESSLAQGRIRDAKRFFEAGALVQDGDSLMPNPCIVGLARLAFHEGELEKAHRYADKLYEPVMTGVVPKGFPNYGAAVVLLEDAALAKDKSQALQLVGQVAALGTSDQPTANEYVLAFDDKDARKALKTAGFTDILARLEPVFAHHEAMADSRTLTPRKQPVDSPSES